VISFSIAMRKFFSTTDGRIGLGPPGMRKGDTVCIVPGSKAPLVLRSSEQRFTLPESGLVVQCHEFVRDCYMNGIMDGEAIVDFERRHVEVFLL